MIISIFIKQSFHLYVLVLNKINKKKKNYIILVLPQRNLLLQNKKKIIFINSKTY